MILFDVSPISSGIGIALAVALLLVCLAISFIAFKMLQKTVKMAIRLIIVAVIILIALVGGTALIFMGSSSAPVKPPVKTTR